MCLSCESNVFVVFHGSRSNGAGLTDNKTICPPSDVCTYVTKESVEFPTIPSQIQIRNPFVQQKIQEIR